MSKLVHTEVVKIPDVQKDNQDQKFNVVIQTDGAVLEGVLRVPHYPKGVVLFAHGSGSGRHSPRNNYVAGVLRKARIASLLFDLLTEEEDQLYQNRFNTELLTERLIQVTNWVKKQPAFKKLKIGYFGASTGAAAALIAAARIGKEIGAVVSRGGRPDLAVDEIEKVKTPVLLIVGENDPDSLEFNQAAYQLLNTTKKMVVIPNATHLFEEKGTLEEAAQLASTWFKKYLTHNFKESFRTL